MLEKTVLGSYVTLCNIFGASGAHVFWLHPTNAPRQRGIGPPKGLGGATCGRRASYAWREEQAWTLVGTKNGFGMLEVIDGPHMAILNGSPGFWMLHPNHPWDWNRCS